MKAFLYYLKAVLLTILLAHTWLELGFQGFLFSLLALSLFITLPNYSYVRHWISPKWIGSYLVLLACICAVVFVEINPAISIIIFGFISMVSAIEMNSKETRQNYSLFLNTPTPESETESEKPNSQSTNLRISKTTIRDFTQFLAENRLILKDQKQEDGLELSLTPIRFNSINICISAGLSSASKLIVRNDGTFRAQLGEKDKTFLNQKRQQPLSEPDIQSRESNVSRMVASAFQFWSAGHVEQARKELKVDPPGSLKSLFPKLKPVAKSQIWYFKVSACSLICLGSYQVWTNPYGLPNSQICLKAIPIQESDVHAFFQDVEQLDMESDKHVSHLRHLMTYRAMVLPPVEMLGPKVMTLLTNDTSLGRKNMNDWRHNLDDVNLLAKAVSDWNFARCVYAGYIELPKEPDSNWKNILTKMPPDWTPIDNLSYDHRDQKQYERPFLQKAYYTIGLLKAYTNLDVFDWTNAHEQISKIQYLQPNEPFGTFSDLNFKGLEGLIIAVQYPMMDTWRALQILEWTDGLDHIDQEACIEGILNLHYGKGLFYYNSKKSNLVSVNGEASTTYCAFNSLRILNALDRVKDLEKWEFRPKWSNHERKNPEKFSATDYQKIEAWLMEKEFRTFLAQNSR